MGKFKIEGRRLVIKDGVTEICEMDFANDDIKNFEEIECIELPNTLKNIQARTFFDHFVNVKEIDLKNVEYIGEMAFFGMDSLEEIVLKNSIKIIKKQAFCNCKNLSIKVVCEKGLPAGWDKNFYANVKSVVKVNKKSEFSKEDSNRY